MDGEIALRILTTLAGAVVFALVAGGLGRTVRRQALQARPGELRQPRSMLAIGVVCTLFFVTLAVVSNLFPNDSVSWVTTSVFVGFALLGAVGIADYFVSQHRFTNEGLYFRGLTGRSGFMAWGTIRHVEYKATLKWIRVESLGGDVARLSVTLVGLPAFARALLKNVSTHIIDPESVAVIEETAHGMPPSAFS